MAELVYGIITINHHSHGEVGIMWFFHFVSLGVRLQSRESSIFWLVTEGGQFTYSLYNFYRATMTVYGVVQE